MVTGAVSVKLGFAELAELIEFFKKYHAQKDVERRLRAAWRELVKGDAADESVIEAALAAAAAAGDTSEDHIRLARAYGGSGRKAKKKAKTGVKRKAAKKPKKKAAKRKKK